MAGLGEYEGTGDYSAIHAQKRTNAFLMAQGVSANTVDKNSPNKFIFTALATLGKLAGKAIVKKVATTAVKTAVSTAVKGIGTKLAATKVGGALVKGAKWVGKKVVKPIKQFTSKIFGGKKPNIGNVSKEISVKDAGTGAQHAASGGFGSTITPKAPSSYSDIAKSTTKITPSTSTTTSVAAPSATTASKEGFNVKAEIKKKWGEFKENVPSRIKGSMDANVAESKQQAQELSASASSKLANLPTIGDVAQEEELESITDSPSVYNKKYRSGPFRMRGWSPFTKKNSPLAGKKSKMFLDSITAKNKEQMILQASGSGFGLDPITFQKIKK